MNIEQANEILAQHHVDQEALDDFFHELWGLRESGDMNMLESPRWLEDEFDVPKKAARAIFYKWAKTFEEPTS